MNTAPFPTLPIAKAALIRDLLRKKKTRDAEQAFVLEGMKPILELLRANSPSLLAIVVTPACLGKGGASLQRALAQARPAVYTCRETVFETLSDVRTSPGMLAVLSQPEWDQAVIFKRPRLFCLYGECLQDPANVGTIMRTAVAFGVDALWLSSDSADVFSPKVVRATTGALLKLPVFSLNDVALFARHDCAILAADSSGKRSRRIDEIETIPARSVIALGNESRGLSQTPLDRAALRFHIPISREVESLNVAASAAIALFYFSGLLRESSDE
ncbi:MAG: TrmH family RNA methyltransferase [Nitrospiraceae bacterium]